MASGCCACWSFLWGAGGLKVGVEGGGYVATTSQTASRESGMLFESLGNQFGLSILLCANLHNDPRLCCNKRYIRVVLTPQNGSCCILETFGKFCK